MLDHFGFTVMGFGSRHLTSMIVQEKTSAAVSQQNFHEVYKEQETKTVQRQTHKR